MVVLEPETYNSFHKLLLKKCILVISFHFCLHLLMSEEIGQRDEMHNHLHEKLHMKWEAAHRSAPQPKAQVNFDKFPF